MDGQVAVVEEDVNRIFLVFAMLFVSCDESSTQNNQSAPILDMTPPTVSFMSPSNNETIEGSKIISIMAQDDKKVEEVDIYVKGPSSSEYYNVASWRSLTSPYANYSYSWDTELEDNGEYHIKAIVNDHNTYNLSGNAGATEDIIVSIYNQSIGDDNNDDGDDGDDGGSGGGDTNGYIAVKNVSHHKSMGGVYGSLTKLRKIAYASSEDLSECSCMACNNNFQYDFVELYYKPSTRSIKYKKAGDGNYSYGTISADKHCIRYTTE